MNNLDSTNLNRISDEIFQLGSNCTVKFNVSLKKQVNENEVFFYQEFEYNGRKDQKGISVKKSFDYYMSIENYQKKGDVDKAFIRIGIKEFPLFKRALAICITWFTSKKYAKLFVKVGRNISVAPPIPEHTINNLPMNKWLRFEPVVHESYIGQQEPALRMYLSDSLNYTDITIDTLIGFNELLSTFNFFQVAESMLPKITIPLGTNRIKLDNAEYYHKQPNPMNIGGIPGRKPSSTKKGLNDL